LKTLRRELEAGRSPRPPPHRPGGRR
jgi:hypothetical protein